jgi:hypothetical protein
MILEASHDTNCVAEATQVDAAEVDREEAGPSDQPHDDHGDLDRSDLDRVEDEIRGESSDRPEGLIDRLVDGQRGASEAGR